MKYTRTLLATLLIGASAFSASLSAKTLTFGTAATYPPYEFIGENNELTGFDIELTKALCKEMQVECKFTNQSFDSLIPALKFKKFDAVIAGLDTTPKRAEQVDFTIPYYDDLAAVMIVKKDTYKTFAELKGKKIGAENGTTHQRYLQDKQKDLNIISYDSYLNAFTDLKSNRTEGVFGDIAAINDWLKANPDYVIMEERAKDPEYYGEGLAIAVRKGNSELVKQINDALVKFKTTPEYEQLKQKWFKKN